MHDYFLVVLLNFAKRRGTRSEYTLWTGNSRLRRSNEVKKSVNPKTASDENLLMIFMSHSYSRGKIVRKHDKDFEQVRVNKIKERKAKRFGNVSHRQKLTEKCGIRGPPGVLESSPLNPSEHATPSHPK